MSPGTRSIAQAMASALLLAGVVRAEPPAPAPAPASRPRNETVVKLADHGFFFVDLDHNGRFRAESDAKFRIQGGNVGGFPIVGDFDGDGQDQVGLLDDRRFYLDDGNFSWRPAIEEDTWGWFAPNMGTTHVVVGDFDGDGKDDFARFTRDGTFYADANGDRRWGGARGGAGAMDGEFKIQGGQEPGVPFACECGTGRWVLGIMTASKVYLDANGDFHWTPAAGTERMTYFAPQEGLPDAVVVGDFDGDGDTDLARVAGDYVFVDRNGDNRWQPDVDGKLRIEGGVLSGARYLAGRFRGTQGPGDVLARLTGEKLYVDADRDFRWHPAQGGEVVTDFAPNVGLLRFVGAGAFDPMAATGR